MELPFSFVDGFILVRAQVEGSSQPLTFLLDSGASTAVLSLSTARRLHLPLGRSETVRGVGADSVAWHLPGLPVTAAGLTLSRLTLAVDLQNAAGLCREPIDGLIGVDFFKGRIVRIDYAAGRIRLLDAAPEGAATRLPLRELNGVLCAGVSVNGSQPRWTRVDTGCNDALHWVVPRTAETKKRGATIGFVTRQQDITRAAVVLGDLAVPNVETSLHGQAMFPGEAGLLGNGLLSSWTVTIDAVHQQLSLAPASRP